MIELKVEQPNKISQLEKGIKKIFKNGFLQKDEYDEASAWILVFGEADESMLGAYDDKFESIA